MPASQGYMPNATVWGTTEPSGTAVPPNNVSVKENTDRPPYVESMNPYTGSAQINGQLVAQTRPYFYVDIPRGTILKWIPASPPQPTPSSPGFAGYTDPGLLDPSIAPMDEFVQSHTGHSHMRNDPWMALRAHVWVIFGMIIVGAILLQWGHWTYPHSQSEVK